MKIQTFKLVCVTVFLTCALMVYAATEEWDYDGQQQIVQVVADGNGGCAFLRMSTNHIQSLVWLDSVGQVVLVFPGPTHPHHVSVVVNT